MTRYRKLFAPLLVALSIMLFLPCIVTAAAPPEVGKITVFGPLSYRMSPTPVHSFTGNPTWVLSPTEAKYMFLTGSSGTTSCQIVAPAVIGQVYFVRNMHGAQTVKITDASGSINGVTIAAGKTAGVIYKETQTVPMYVRMTSDATN